MKRKWVESLDWSFEKWLRNKYWVIHNYDFFMRTGRYIYGIHQNDCDDRGQIIWFKWLRFRDWNNGLVLKANLVWMSIFLNTQVGIWLKSLLQNIHQQIKFFYNQLDMLASMLFWMIHFIKGFNLKHYLCKINVQNPYCIWGCLITFFKYQLCAFNTMLPKPNLNKKFHANISENIH